MEPERARRPERRAGLERQGDDPEERPLQQEDREEAHQREAVAPVGPHGLVAPVLLLLLPPAGADVEGEPEAPDGREDHEQRGPRPTAGDSAAATMATKAKPGPQKTSAMEASRSGRERAQTTTM